MYIYLHRHKSIEGFVNLTIKDFLLYHNFNPNRNKGRINEKVYKTLQLMIDRGFIQFTGCYSNGGLDSLNSVNCNMMFTIQIINFDKYWNPENRFTKIFYAEIDTLRSRNVMPIDKVLNLYINIKKRMSSDTDCMSAALYAYPSEDTLSKECGCSVSTIKTYTNILCDTGMLYVKNFGSYMKLKKGKEVVINSNNVYALEERFLDDSAKEALRDYLKRSSGYVDGFFPFCDNLPHNKKESTETVFNSSTDTKKSDSDNEDNWGEANSLEDSVNNDFTIEEIIEMPSAGDLESEEKQIVKQNIEKPKDDKNTSYEVPTRVIYMKKKEQNREIPIDVKIQEYADDLYEQHGYGTDYEMSIFIAELSEKFPGLDDYGKYYNRAKKYHEMGV